MVLNISSVKERLSYFSRKQKESISYCHLKNVVVYDIFQQASLFLFFFMAKLLIKGNKVSLSRPDEYQPPKDILSPAQLLD